MNQLTRVNWSRFFLAFCFFIAQNTYFGWNMHPRSAEELIADGITFLLLSLAIKGEKA